MCLAVPGKVLQIDHLDDFSRMAKVDFDGVTQEINLSYLPDAAVGDYVIVHVGFGIARLDEKAAEATLRYLEEMVNQ